MLRDIGAFHKLRSFFGGWGGGVDERPHWYTYEKGDPSQSQVVLSWRLDIRRPIPIYTFSNRSSAKKLILKLPGEGTRIPCVHDGDLF